MKAAPMPSRAALQAAYEALQFGVIPEPEALVLWAQWGRADARLAELLVRFLAEHFRRINPVALWERNLASPMPQALAVLVDFAKLEARRSRGEAGAFETWGSAVLRKVPKAPPQLFFLREGLPKPERDLREVDRNLKPFFRWGFFGAESPVGGKQRRTGTVLSRGARLRVLRELARGRKLFSVKDYIQACGGLVQRRTAERDLLESALLRREGNTKGRRYIRR